MSLIEPTNGEIQVDGNQLKNIKHKWQKIAYIPQNFYILDDTILKHIVWEDKDNINHDLLSEALRLHLINLLMIYQKNLIQLLALMEKNFQADNSEISNCKSRYIKILIF